MRGSAYVLRSTRAPTLACGALATAPRPRTPPAAGAVDQHLPGPRAGLPSPHGRDEPTLPAADRRHPRPQGQCRLNVMISRETSNAVSIHCGMPSAGHRQPERPGCGGPAADRPGPGGLAPYGDSTRDPDPVPSVGCSSTTVATRCRPRNSTTTKKAPTTARAMRQKINATRMNRKIRKLLGVGLMVVSAAPGGRRGGLSAASTRCRCARVAVAPTDLE